MVGICPRNVPVLFGQLVPRRCAQDNFVAAQGPYTVYAGPCGAMHFDLYGKRQSVAHPQNSKFKRVCGPAISRLVWWRNGLK